MHMADALLSPAVGLAFWGASGALAHRAARRVKTEPDYEKKVPLMGVLGAFVFAAQMINFSIPGTGSSGHLGGGLLLAILLGPHAGLLVLASVLAVQCLFFADGGLLALGANVFNLGFWPAVVGLPLYHAIAGTKPGRRMPALAAVAAAVVALELGAFGVAVQTLLSGRTDLSFAQFSALLFGIHLPIAVVEGLVTAGVLELVRARMPVPGPARAHAPWLSPVVLPLLGAALFVGCFVVWFSSARPDGLEWSVAKLEVSAGLEPPSDAMGNALGRIQERTAIMPGYALPAGKTVGDAPKGSVDWVTSAAALLGILLTGGAVAALSGLLLRARGERLQEPVRAP
jgi:cobalt/nickel transport system permease protein